ncbi:hypothetical protein VV11_001910 [Trichodesmium erythraeum 21-75]|nr:hypothetical protein [Trichodesmium erythraeum 21-75]
MALQIADALYRLVCQHKDNPDTQLEAGIYQLIEEMRSREWRTRRNRFRRMYDDRWRDLTPDLMFPIDAPERTRELSFNVKNNTAMPGIGESMGFAARLGIGRHVPCFVFFTDIGELTIDVFPVGNLSADEAFYQMRYWIDDFYQENQVSLNKWNQVEQDIISFISSIDRSLTDIKDWINKSERLWDELILVAQIIEKLRKLGQQTTEYKSLIDNLSTSSWRCNRIVSDCRVRLESISKKREKHQLEQENLKVVIDKLKTISISTNIYDECLLAASQLLTSEASKILEKAAKRIKQKSNSKFISLENQLFQWWGNTKKCIPSFNKFKKAHKKQSELHTQSHEILKSKYNNFMASIFISLENQLFQWWGNTKKCIPSFNKFKKAHKKQSELHTQSHEILKSKYNNFIASIFELPFSDRQEIFLEKAKQLCDESDIDFSEYSLQLTEFFTQLHTQVPKWIDGTNLKISILFPFKSRDSISFDTVMASIGYKHPISQMIRENMTVEQKKKKEKLVSETERIVLQYRDEALAELIKLRKQPLDVSTEEIDTYSTCLDNMYNLRNEIENELINLANSSSSLEKSLRLVEPKDIENFLKLLNEYRETTNKFFYPYKKNPRIQQVNIDQPLPQIFELKLRENQLNTSNTRARELEQKLAKTIPNYENGVKLLQNVQQKSYTVTPKARLVSEILKIKESPQNSSRPNSVPPIFSDSNYPENFEEILCGLNDQELRILSNSIAKLDLDAVVGSREEIINIILTIVGLLPSRELTTHRQYANRPINLEVSTMTESKNVEVEMNFNSQVIGATGKNEGIININTSDRQILAEAAEEIQKLLRQLEKTNPSATELEQVAYVDVTVYPSLKQRTIAALRAGGGTAIDEFFLENKYLKVGKAIVQAWLQPSS